PTPCRHIYPLPLHDALPISMFKERHLRPAAGFQQRAIREISIVGLFEDVVAAGREGLKKHEPADPLRDDVQAEHGVAQVIKHAQDRKSTRLNSSHRTNSYAV